ncbi:MAG: YjfB family protein [Lachnospiraceae bacterium]|nr:YjfB family protein [Lachnospiraceae bacterium]
MDIVALSMVMAQNQIMDSVGVAMLDKSLEMQEMAGSEVIQLLDGAALERSVNPAIGGNIDLMI